jgi:hypothetical protein
VARDPRILQGELDLVQALGIENAATVEIKGKGSEMSRAEMFAGRLEGAPARRTAALGSIVVLASGLSCIRVGSDDSSVCMHVALALASGCLLVVGSWVVYGLSGSASGSLIVTLGLVSLAFPVPLQRTKSFRAFLVGGF